MAGIRGQRKESRMRPLCGCVVGNLKRPGGETGFGTLSLILGTLSWKHLGYIPQEVSSQQLDMGVRREPCESLARRLSI